MWWSFFSTTLPYFEAVFLPIKQFPDLGIDIRRKVLIAYRDYVILPLYPRLEGTPRIPSPLGLVCNPRPLYLLSLLCPFLNLLMIAIFSVVQPEMQTKVSPSLL